MKAVDPELLGRGEQVRQAGVLGVAGAAATAPRLVDADVGRRYLTHLARELTRDVAEVRMPEAVEYGTREWARLQMQAVGGCRTPARTCRTLVRQQTEMLELMLREEEKWARALGQFRGVDLPPR